MSQYVLRMLVLALPIVLVLGACKDKEKVKEVDSEVKQSLVADVDAHYLTAEPAGAVGVLAGKKTAKNGERVVLEGRVKDFIDGLSAFTLIDSSLRACSDAGDPMGENCKTPWDYCCIDQKEITAATVNVELRDGAVPFPYSLKGFHGLDNLKHVVVTGQALVDKDGNVTLVAKGLHVKS
jgi:hypothetical protein